MNKLFSITAVAALAATAAMADVAAPPSCNAGSLCFSWDLTGGATPGHPHDFTPFVTFTTSNTGTGASSTLNLLARGYTLTNTAATDIGAAGFNWTTTGAATALEGKKDGGDEIGLGIKADPSGDNEIYQLPTGTNLSSVQRGVIQIDDSAIQGLAAIKTFGIGLGSVQSGEGFDIFGSNTLGTPGLLLFASGHAGGDVFVDLSSSFRTYQFFTIAADSGKNRNVASNVLIHSAGAGSTATPEPATMLLSGVGAGALLLFRKRLTRKA